MRINSSSIGMESARSYRATSITIRSAEKKDYFGAFAGLNMGNEDTKASEESQENENKISGSSKFATKDYFEELRDKINKARTDFQARSEEKTSYESIRQQTILQLLELLFGDYKERLKERLKEMTNASIGEGNGVGTINATSEIGGFEGLGVVGETGGMGVMTTSAYICDYYNESEETSFSADGIVKTSDGREISFGIDISMSRAFTRTFEQEIKSISLCDPLVINLDGNIANVSDQKIHFDIEGDGVMDTIGRLENSSGYLALDKNNDGIINDGTELFGTKTGDGFADLAKYDEDGNGWIDEGDSIFNKLKIMCIGEDGNQELYTLAEKGIGALGLTKIATNFSDKDDSNNTKGVIRNTGIFLYENGMAGTVQHVDLAKYYA